VRFFLFPCRAFKSKTLRHQNRYEKGGLHG